MSNLKTYINKYYNSTTMDAYTRVACSCILYKYISDMNTNNDIYELVDSYADTIIVWFKSLENNYLSYESILTKVKKYNKTFLNYNSLEINTIYNLFTDTTKIEYFSIKNQSPEMYKLKNIPFSKIKEFNNLHTNAMALIIRSYILSDNAAEKDMQISYVNDNFNYVIFQISSINSIRVVLDLLKETVMLNLDIINVEYKTDGIHLRIKNN